VRTRGTRRPATGQPRVDPALAELCQREHVRLIGLVALYVGDRALAEDIAQEALVRLHQQWASVRTKASPSAWLSVVGMNLARSWWRRRYIEQRANRRHAAGARADAAGPEPADVLAVRAAVAALPSRQRAALVLRYYAGLSVGETAAALGCPEGTVKSLTKRAISGLRTTFVDLDATPESEEADHA
jgi:RNA polymerase sigma-70 factor (sigma-E family)